MSEKFTPGPWALCHGGLPTDDGFSIQTKNMLAKRVHIVAECWPCSIVDKQHREELSANARLIAAAPDLYAVCKKFCDYYPHGINPELNEAYAEGRAALAKAQGTQA